jgi:WD40 repeat protein
LIQYQSTLVHNLDFPPVSMSVNSGFLAAGGHESQLSIKNLHTNEVVRNNVNVGGAINNGCHVSRYYFNDHQTMNSILQRTPRMFVSNNDNSIKVYTLPSMSRMSSVNLHVPCNYSTTSMDGKYMAAVGDNNYVHLFDMKNNFALIARMQGKLLIILMRSISITIFYRIL